MGVVNGSPESIRRDNVLDLDEDLRGGGILQNAGKPVRLFECFEKIEANNAVALNAEGKLVKADLSVSANKEPFGISKTAGEKGENIELFAVGEYIKINGAEFGINKEVFLGTPISTSFIFQKGHFLSFLGTAISADTFLFSGIRNIIMK